MTSAREETVLSMFEARKSWLDNMADLQITCRVITIRDRVPMEKNKADFGNKWLKIVDDTWRENLSRVYKNDHYIILSIEDKKDAVKDLNYASQSVVAGRSCSASACIRLRASSMRLRVCRPARPSSRYFFSRDCSSSLTAWPALPAS